MITSAKPIAISKSRVHTRISWRKESNDGGCSEEVLGEIPAELFEFTLDAPGFSSECSILLPSIYNMSVAERARFRFWLAACAATPPPGREIACCANGPSGGARCCRGAPQPEPHSISLG